MCVADFELFDVEEPLSAWFLTALGVTAVVERDFTIASNIAAVDTSNLHKPIAIYRKSWLQIAGLNIQEIANLALSVLYEANTMVITALI